MSPEVPRSYRVWFYAAAVYNVLWGLAAGIFPEFIATTGGLAGATHPSLVQAIGMMVGVYGLGYYLLARDPIRYAGFIWIGLLGKLLGPLGFLYHALQGSLPWQFGWLIVFNDLIWWPAFTMFALKYARKQLG